MVLWKVRPLHPAGGAEPEAILTTEWVDWQIQNQRIADRRLQVNAIFLDHQDLVFILDDDLLLLPMLALLGSLS